MADETAAPSTATLDAAQDAALASNDVAAYIANENKREIAERNGTAIPEAPPAPSEKPAAASETAKPEVQEKPETAKRIKDLLDARVLLENENVRLKAELEGKSKPGEKKADPPPADAAEKKTAKATAPAEPKLEDFATYAEFQAADRKYIRELVQFETRQVLTSAEAEKTTATANKAIEDSWKKRVTDAETAHGNPEEFRALAFANMPVNAATDGFILDSEVGPQVLYHLQLDGQAEGKRIFALPPYAAARALHLIEMKILGQKTAVTAPVKRHTAAPPPATDLAARGAEPADAEQAALNRNDVGTYMRLANARELKTARGG